MSRKEIVWNLAEAMSLVRKLEEFLIPLELHVALAGSVLHKGESSKDIDLFIYPHTAWTVKKEDVVNSLKDFGMTCIKNEEEVKKKWKDKCAEILSASLLDFHIANNHIRLQNLSETEDIDQAYHDDKIVEIWDYKGKRVDIFMPWVE